MKTTAAVALQKIPSGVRKSPVVTVILTVTAQNSVIVEVLLVRSRERLGTIYPLTSLAGNLPSIRHRRTICILTSVCLSACLFPALPDRPRGPYVLSTLRLPRLGGDTAGS